MRNRDLRSREVTFVLDRAYLSKTRRPEGFSLRGRAVDKGSFYVGFLKLPGNSIRPLYKVACRCVRVPVIVNDENLYERTARPHEKARLPPQDRELPQLQAQDQGEAEGSNPAILSKLVPAARIPKAPPLWAVASACPRTSLPREFVMAEVWSAHAMSQSLL